MEYVITGIIAILVIWFAVSTGLIDLFAKVVNYGASKADKAIMTAERKDKVKFNRQMTKLISELDGVDTIVDEKSFDQVWKSKLRRE